jgi:hypothetical protein
MQWITILEPEEVSITVVDNVIFGLVLLASMMMLSFHKLFQDSLIQGESSDYELFQSKKELKRVLDAMDGCACVVDPLKFTDE